MTSLIKCYHYNLGYCKEKDSCIYIHNKEECPTNCKQINCILRHKRKCKDGDECFYYQNNICEFDHNKENKIHKKN